MKGKHFKIAMAGKITVGAGIFALLAIALLSTVGFVSTTADAAKSATTTVKVLNTPPQFVGEPEEVVPSTIANPTNFDSTITFKVNAKDSSNNGMYLLVCKTLGKPTAYSDKAPTCLNNDMIAVTESPVIGNYPDPTTMYATSSKIDDAVTETQNWFAYLCDNETRNPRCTEIDKHGVNGTDAASPYYINHLHSFTALTNNGPKLPGEIITFTATADEVMHKDVVGPQDTIKLFVCKLSDFTGTDCGAGGTWASSTAGVAKDPSVGYQFTIPYQDGMYSGYGYIVDSHGAVAAGGVQGQKVDFGVSNAAPQVTESSITFASSTLVLTKPLDQTTGFGLTFETTDNNSCQNTLAGEEMKSVKVLFGRDELIGGVCTESAASYDPNRCYTSEVDQTVWNLVCEKKAGSCQNKNDISIDWECSFPLWSNAQPTDVGTPWANKDWNARITIIDDNNASTSNKIASPARFAKVQSFPFIELNSNTIDFGEFEPGAVPPNLGSATGSVLGVKSQGNTALDVSMKISDMCPKFAQNGFKCTGNEKSNTIYGIRQHYATSSVPYWSSLAATGSTSTLADFDLNVKKPTATGTPTSKDLFWGIAVPADLTESGDYSGVNNIELKVEPTVSTW